MRAIQLAIPFVAAGMLFAQTTPSPQAAPPATSQKAHHRRMGAMHHLTAELNLTADQQTKAHAIFAKARAERKALAPQIRAERQAMFAAVKSDSASQIDQLSRQNAELNAKVRAIHTRSIAEFRTVLNADQQAKFDKHLDRMFGNRMQARQHRAQGNTQG